MSQPDKDVLNAVPGIPRNSDGPVFAEPWQAQAFAMAVTLNERGVFTWTEWAAALAAEIKSAQASGDPDLGDTYYNHWLAALEHLVAEKSIACETALETRKQQWDHAARSTPHGEPIVLGKREN